VELLFLICPLTELLLIFTNLLLLSFKSSRFAGSHTIRMFT
jgi:hypothetical protein